MKRDTQSALDKFLASVAEEIDVPPDRGFTIAEAAARSGTDRQKLDKLIRAKLKAGTLKRIGKRGREYVYE